MKRAEQRRNYRKILKEFLKSKRISWRKYRDYLGARHKISFAKRMKLVAASYGIGEGLI